jgi:hypothetical protein
MNRLSGRCSRATAAPGGGRVMTMKEKLLVLWVFVMVIVAFMFTHVAGHLVFVLENCFAFALGMLKL